MKASHLIHFTHTFFCIWRYCKMYKQTMDFVRGMGTGMVAGMALATVSTQMMKNKRGLRRRANKTLHTVGEVMDNMQDMFK